jgi:hypothetical protein
MIQDGYLKKKKCHMPTSSDSLCCPVLVYKVLHVSISTSHTMRKINVNYFTDNMIYSTSDKFSHVSPVMNVFIRINLALALAILYAKSYTIFSAE